MQHEREQCIHRLLHPTRGSQQGDHQRVADHAGDAAAHRECTWRG